MKKLVSFIFVISIIFSLSATKVYAAVGKPSPTATVLSDGDIKLSWANVPSAYQYEITVRENVSGTVAAVVDRVLTSNTYITINSHLLKPNTQYRYCVMSMASSSDTALSNTLYFTTPSVMKVTPEHNLRSDGGVTIYWDDAAYAKKYEITVSEDVSSNVTPIVNKVIIEDDNNTTNSCDIKTSLLKADTQYRYCIKSISENGSSVLTNTMYFKTAKKTVLKELQKPNPTSSLKSNGDVTISWSQIPDVFYYEVLVYQGYGNTKLVDEQIVTSYGTSCTISASKLDSNTDYNYTVKAVSSGYNPGISSTKYFKTSNLTAPTVTAKSLSNGDISIDWNLVPYADYYEVKVGWSDIAPLIFDQTMIKKNNVIIPERYLDLDKEYFYTVTACSDNAQSATSVKKSFKLTTLAKPIVYTYVEPNGDIEIRWEAIPYADNYQVEIFSKGDNKRAVVMDTTVAYATVKSSSLEGSKEYVCIVSAKAAGKKSDSNPASFTTLKKMDCLVSGYVQPNFKYEEKVKSKLLEGFKVQVVGTSISDITDSNGFFDFTLQTGKYQLKITKQGYLDRIVDVEVKSTCAVLSLSSSSAPITMCGGDLVADNAINAEDYMEIVQVYNTSVGEPNYDVTRDINLDGGINMEDIMVIIQSMGKTSLTFK